MKKLSFILAGLVLAGGTLLANPQQKADKKDTKKEVKKVPSKKKTDKKEDKKAK
jgi:hypothetical protein